MDTEKLLQEAVDIARDRIKFGSHDTVLKTLLEFYDAHESLVEQMRLWPEFIIDDHGRLHHIEHVVIVEERKGDRRDPVIRTRRGAGSRGRRVDAANRTGGRRHNLSLRRAYSIGRRDTIRRQREGTILDRKVDK